MPDRDPEWCIEILNPLPFVDVVLRSRAVRRRLLLVGPLPRRDDGRVHHAPRLPLVQRLERRPLLQQSPAMLQRGKFYCLLLLLTKIVKT